MQREALPEGREISHHVRTLGVGEGTEAEWRRLRRRWDHLHLGRIVLDLAGLVLVALAAID